MANTYRRRRNNEEEGVIGLLFLALFFAFSYFFQNTNLVFLIFEMSVLGLFLVVIFNSIYHVWHEDNESAFENAFIILPLLCLFSLGLFYIENIPRDLIAIMDGQNLISFFFNDRLSDYDRDLSFDIFTASLLLLTTLLYNIYNTYNKLVNGYILQKSYSVYIVIVVNLSLLLLSMFTFSIGIFR